MPRNTDLFDLIKSMTPAEKRQLRLSAGSRADDSNYLQLFDAIDAQEEYDEGAIKQHFSDKAFVRQLHVTKNYLWRQIMKCLRPRYGAASRQHEIRELIVEAEILYDRELFDQCRRILDKAENLAREFECFAELLSVLSWQRKLTIQLSTVGNNRNLLLDVIEQENELLLVLLNLNDYNRLSAGIYDTLDRERANPDDPEVQRELAMLESADQALSLNARILYYYAAQTYAFFQNRHDQACEAIEAKIAMLEGRPRYIREYPRVYVTTLTNYAAVLLHLKRYDKLEATLLRIRELPEELRWKERSPTMVKVLLQTYNLELEMYRDRGLNKRGLALQAETTALLNRYRVGAARDYHILFAYQYAYLHFRQGAFNEALEQLNVMFSFGKETERIHVAAYGHMLRLLIYFELGHITVLKYSIESYRRYINKRSAPMIFEREILRFFARICQAPPDDYNHILHELWHKLFNETDGMAAGHADHFALFNDYLNIRQWLGERLNILTQPAA